MSHVSKNACRLASCDGETASLLQLALSTVPEPVQRFALKRVFVVSTVRSGFYGWMRSRQGFAGRDLIVLTELGLRAPNIEDVLVTLRHEVAHSWLGHGKGGDHRVNEAYVRLELSHWAAGNYTSRRTGRVVWAKRNKRSK